MKLILFFSTIMTFVLSCGDNTSKDGQLKTTSGFPYVMVKDVAGDPPGSGDKIRFFITVRHNGAVVAEEDFTGTLPDISALSSPKPETELLYLLSPGDSAIMTLMGDHLNVVQIQGLGSNDTVTYHIGYQELVHTKEHLAAVENTYQQLLGYLNETLEAKQNNSLGDDLVVWENGMKSVLHKKGEGWTPGPGAEVAVHFVSALSNGKIFSDTKRLGEPFKFTIGEGQTIQGWAEMILSLQEGAIMTAFIPSDLGYGVEGVEGVVPPNEDLIYSIEVVSIKEVAAIKPLPSF